MKKIIVLGASRLQIPLIKKVNEMGHYSIVIDYDENALGKKYADEFHLLSTNDEEGVLELAREVEADAVVTCATDFPMRTVAYVSEALGLTSISYDTAIKATDKLEMAKALKEAGVNAPAFAEIKAENSEEEILEKIHSLKYPLISKPAASSGSRGVIKINHPDQFIESIKHSFKYSDDVIVEECVEGNDEVSVEILVQNCEIFPIAITDKVTTGAPYFIETAHVEPSSYSQEIQEAIYQLAIDAVKAIGIDNGAAHVEIKIEDGIPYIIEIGARLGGGGITSSLVPLSTGVDMLKGIIKIALNEPLQINEIKRDLYSIHMLMPLAGTHADFLKTEELLESYADRLNSYAVYFEKEGMDTETHSGHDRIAEFIIAGPYQELSEKIKQEFEQSCLRQN